jgi:Na+/melibiose symporter-like transporter
VEKHFEDCKVGSDMKLLFIEQHSMKLGDRVFYALESKRQKYLSGMEMLPYLGSAIGFCFFIGFALWTPLHSKLYKESLYSLGMGMAVAAQVPIYYRRDYIRTVESVYDQLIARFEMYPHLN